MSWLKTVFGSQSSQETKFYHEKSKEEWEKKEEEPQISDLKIDEGNNENSQESDNSWFSSWSGLSTTFDSPKGKRRKFCNDDEEEDKWWSSFCGKERNGSKSESVFFYPTKQLEPINPSNKHTNTNLRW